MLRPPSTRLLAAAAITAGALGACGGSISPAGESGGGAPSGAPANQENELDQEAPAAPGAPVAPAARGVNLLLIAVDTLRADRLGAYGYERPTSPAIDRLFAESVVFDAAYATSSWTLPSFASLFTAHYSSTHGCWQFDNALDDSFTTLAELAREAGYRTAGIVSHVFLGKDYGLAQGFEEYDEELVHETKRASHRAISSPALTRKAKTFLRARAEAASASEDARPWFLFLHYFDPHDAYQVHRGVSDAFGVDELTDRYDGEIAFTDRHVGEVLDALDRHGQTENTVVVFVADHGEEFGDHGGSKHGGSVYEEVVRVPFAMRVPDLAPRRVEATVSGVDLVPTLVELLGLPAPGGSIAGRSLVDVMAGGAGLSRGALMELRLDRVRKDVTQEALVDGRWKLIVETPRPGVAAEGAVRRARLFDLKRDPAERTDVGAEHPETLRRLERELAEALSSASDAARAFESAETLELSDTELERLRELGYMGDDEAEDDS